ncbi:aspartate 1-decarboxylase [Candidatus Acetothermia bacterium]|nr:aspartate 1-decarboxylase [Candidatus Acetothermia bacterium]MBI3642754.1 aspartate 1-decarboxylase [Candidatus Acetothermia bacterium]
MRIELLKSKIHRAKITDKNLGYEGSLTLDQDLMDAAGIFKYEKIQLVNVNNGSRLETYAIPGERGTGDVVLNGAAARWGEIGDVVIIISYAQIDQHGVKGFEPKIVLVDAQNHIKPSSKIA